MDGNESYPLVVLPPEHGSLVPVSSALVVDLDSPHDSEADLRAVVAFLWGRFCKLATFFFIALALVRRLRLQVSALRRQANYWRAQQQRAVQREAATLQVWGMDTGKWLTAYLSACAKAGGEPPPDPQLYLPWNMTPQQRENLSVAQPKPPDPKPPDANANAPNTSEK